MNWSGEVWKFIYLIKNLCSKTEPIGAKSPMFSTDDKSSSFFRSEGQGLALLCPAQGFPVPMFR